MNIAGIQYFVSVARSKSITAAAHALYITQPALSRHLQRMEGELGAQLFEREGGKMTARLTEAGKLCLRDAQHIVRHADNMVSAVQTYVSGERGVLDVGYCGTEGYWIYELVSRIRKKYPNIEIRAQNISAGKLKQGVLDGSLDLVYLDTRHCASHEKELCYLELEKGRRQVIVSKSHPFAGRESVCLGELAGERFLSWKREVYPEYYDWFQDLCAQNGFTVDTVCFDETEMLLSAVYAGDGFAMYHSAYRQPIDLNVFSVLDIRQDNGEYFADSALALVWNSKNGNPCLPTVIKLAKELSQQ